MLPKERIKAAMELSQPDRIPFMCQMSIGHMLIQLGVSPAEFWFDADTFANGLLTLREIYGFDGILISLHGHDPGWRKNAEEITKTSEGERVEWKNGDVTLCRYDDLPQHFPAATKTSIELTDALIEHLPQKLEYIPVSQGLHFMIDQDHKFDVYEAIVKKAGGEYSIHGEITSPFDYFLDLFDHENALMLLIDEPGNSKKVLSHFTALIRDLAIDMCNTGIDAIKISSPFAGAGFISPEFYREFVLPFEKEIAKAVRDRGVPVYTHTCGAVSDRLELMLEAGVSGIECLDPPPLGNVELGEAIKRVNGKGFIKGNIDSVNLLLNGSDEEITADTKKKLLLGRKGGGFILSTACSIAPTVKREKILLIKEAVEKWG